MTDHKTLELLSRHLDDDLDTTEDRDLRLRLDADPMLAAELRQLRALRQSVAGLAARERPPAQLDALVEPLLRARPEPVGVRPWVRWLATAAVVVLGLSVVMEVRRGGPAPTTADSPRQTVGKRRVEPNEPFSLAPLPTSSLPAEEQPLGVSDRLLASPIADAKVEVDTPPALEVVGPLDSPAGNTTESAPAVTADEVRQRGALETPIELEAAGKTAVGAAAPATRRDQASPSSAEREKAGPADTGLSTAPLWEPEPPTGRAQLFVFIDGSSAWLEFTPSATCKPGRYSVRIIVGNGAVRVARPVGGAVSESPSQRLCAAELLIDLEISEVADGEYPAEVVVEPRGVGNSMR